MRKRFRFRLPRLLPFLGALSAALPGCRGSGEAPTEAGTITLNGGGATFPYPLYAQWIAEYRRVDPRLLINYQSIGSGAGVRQIAARTVDFGATDDPLTPEEASRMPAPFLQIPSALGAAVLTYNLPGLTGELRVDSQVASGIYLGKILRWDDAALKSANPDLVLPPLPIIPVFRSDGGGTTAIFTRWLASEDAAWREAVGAGKQVRWVVGEGRRRNEGVASAVQSKPGAIGYVELAYALGSQLSVARVRNRAGNWTAPTVAGMQAAVNGVSDPLVSAAAPVTALTPDAYPLTGFTFLVIYRVPKDPAKAAKLGQFLGWALHEGQRFAAPKGYAPLPLAMTARAEQELATLRERASERP